MVENCLRIDSLYFQPAAKVTFICLFLASFEGSGWTIMFHLSPIRKKNSNSSYAFGPEESTWSARRTIHRHDTRAIKRGTIPLAHPFSLYDHGGWKLENWPITTTCTCNQIIFMCFTHKYCTMCWDYSKYLYILEQPNPCDMIEWITRKKETPLNSLL